MAAHSDLPASLWDAVFCHVGDARDLAAAAGVCTRWGVLTTLDAPWIVEAAALAAPPSFPYGPVRDALPRPVPAAGGGPHLRLTGRVEPSAWRLGFSAADGAAVSEGGWRAHVHGLVCALRGRVEADAHTVVESAGVPARVAPRRAPSQSSLLRPFDWGPPDYIALYAGGPLVGGSGGGGGGSINEQQQRRRRWDADPARGTADDVWHQPVSPPLPPPRWAQPSGYRHSSSGGGSGGAGGGNVSRGRVSAPRNDGTLLSAFKAVAVDVANGALAVLDELTGVGPSPRTPHHHHQQQQQHLQPLPHAPPRRGSRTGGGAGLPAESLQHASAHRHPPPRASVNSTAATNYVEEQTRRLSTASAYSDGSDVVVPAPPPQAAAHPLAGGLAGAFTLPDAPASAAVAQQACPAVVTPPGAARVCLLAASEAHLTAVLARLNAASGGDGHVLPRSLTQRFTAWDLILEPPSAPAPVAADSAGGGNARRLPPPFPGPLHVTGIPLGGEHHLAGMDAIWARHAAAAGGGGAFDAFVVVVDASAVYEAVALDGAAPSPAAAVAAAAHAHVASVLSCALAVMRGAGYDASRQPLLVLAEGQQHAGGNLEHATAAADACGAPVRLVPPLSPLLVSFLLRRELADAAPAVQGGSAGVAPLFAVAGASLAHGVEGWGVESGWHWLYRVLARLRHVEGADLLGLQQHAASQSERTPVPPLARRRHHHPRIDASLAGLPFAALHARLAPPTSAIG